MKKTLAIAILLTTIYTSCSNDFDVTAGWKEISVIYGLINPQDTQHFIKIQKAFLDEETGALQIASIGDSLFHQDSLHVTIKDINSGATWTLDKVDGNTIGLIKDPGLFGSAPNTLYTFNANLNYNNTIQLLVRNTRTGKLDSASCDLVNTNLNAQTPGIFNLTSPINLTYTIGASTPYTVLFYTVVDGKQYELDAYIHYHETTTTDTSTVTFRDSIYLPIINKYIAENVNISESVNYPYVRENFFRTIADQLEPKANTIRFFDNIDFYYHIGGQELYNYILINNTQSGIASDQILPKYTNIKGDQSLGIFTSRTTVPVPNIKIDAYTLDSISCGVFTQGLGFAPQPANPFYPFTCN